MALLSLTFDDGLRCHFDKALPVLDRYGIKGTFFLTANNDPTHQRSAGHTNDWWKIDWRPEDLTVLRRMVREGHEIASHGVTHNLAKIQSAPEMEAHHSKQLIEAWIGAEVSSFAYPFSSSHRYLHDAVRDARYRQARGGGVFPQYRPAGSYYAIPWDHSFDRFNIDCRRVSGEEEVGAWVRSAHWHVLTFHGIGGTQDGWAPITLEQFRSQIEELAKCRDTGDVEILTFREGASRFDTVSPLLDR